MKQLGFHNLIASRPSRERSLIAGMVVARIVQPKSKLDIREEFHRRDAELAEKKIYC